jgi:hypothetical protein
MTGSIGRFVEAYRLWAGQSAQCTVEKVGAMLVVYLDGSRIGRTWTMTQLNEIANRLVERWRVRIGGRDEEEI